MSYDQGLFETFGVGEAIILITIWVIMAALAYVHAPDDRRWQFVGLTLVLLGPLGVAAAAIAQPRDPDFYALPYRRAVAAGRQRFICPRCGAENDIRASPQTVLGPRRTSFPVFCFIDFALGIQTFGVAIDR